MKKTMKTAMTAAMFAAAIGTSAGNSPAQHSAAADPAETTVTTTTEVELGGVAPIATEVELGGDVLPYTEELFPDGEIIPEIVTTSSTTASAVDEETLMTVTEEVLPQPVYGPPSFFYGSGDINLDGGIDARDLSEMKRALLTDKIPYGDLALVDLNSDGVFDKEDVKELRRLLIGKTKEQEEAEEAAAQTTAPAFTEIISTDLTTETTAMAMPQPVYGPPADFQ